jgi:xylulokinase
VPSEVLLGADLGTSGLKLVAVDATGAVVVEAEAGYAVRSPAPGHAETDVSAWRGALDDALAAVAPALAGARVLAHIHN